MNSKIDPRAFAFSAGIVAASLMLLLGILGNLGFYTGAVTMMTEWHEFFSLSLLGIVGGMIEAFAITFVVVYALTGLYDQMLPRRRLDRSMAQATGIRPTH